MDNIMVFGRSVTQGFRDTEGGWVQRIRTYLDEKALETGDEENVFYVHNVGISGDTTEDLLERMEEEYWRRTEEGYETLLIIQIGANDAIIEEGQPRVTLREFKENIREVCDLGLEISDELVLVGDFPADPELEKIPYAPNKKLENERIKKYEDAKKKICGNRDITYIDLFALVDDENNSDYLEDGVHPNNEGHVIIFEGVKNKLHKEGQI